VRLEPRDVVAGYAAVVATIALGWQIWSSYRANRPKVTLVLVTWQIRQTAGGSSLDSANVRIRNREDYSVQVEQLYFRYPFRAFRFGPPIPATVEGTGVTGLPFDVPTRTAVSLTLRPDGTYRLASGTWEFAPRIVMELVTGERLTSRLIRQAASI
jgi:hypothetical protein